MYILWNQTSDISWKMIYTGHFFSPLTMMMMPSYTLLCFQLMRQIDLMVSAKKAEWETHVHAVQIQLDKKTKEVEFVKVQLEQKCQEVSVLYWLFSSFINENTSFVMKVQAKKHTTTVHLPFKYFFWIIGPSIFLCNSPVSGNHCDRF